MVVFRYEWAMTAFNRGEDCRFEAVADWWPKFTHRFVPAEEMWRLDGSTILAPDQRAQAMFADILAARDALAGHVAESIGSSVPTNTSQYPELIDPTKSLSLRMAAFGDMAEQRSSVGKPFRPTIWSQELDAWQPLVEEWRLRGPHSSGGVWDSEDAGI
jgi:hypothetical protein